MADELTPEMADIARQDAHDEPDVAEVEEVRHGDA